MPGDLMTDWPLPTSREAFRDRVGHRAGVIAVRRRRLRQMPIAVAALGVLAVVVAAALPNGGAPAQSLRTADERTNVGRDVDDPVVSEELSVDGGDVAASASVDAYAPDGAGVRARTELGVAGSDVGADVGVNGRGSVGRAGHPLLTDPRGDVTMNTAGSATAVPPNDLTEGDITLDGDDLVFRVTVDDLSALRSGAYGESVSLRLRGVAFGDLELLVSTTLDRSLRADMTAPGGRVNWLGEVGGGDQGGQSTASAAYGHVDVPTRIEVDEASSSVVFRMALTELNRQMASSSAMAPRRAQGDVTFRPGTRLHRLGMRAVGASRQDEAWAPSDQFWAIGD